MSTLAVGCNKSEVTMALQAVVIISNSSNIAYDMLIIKRIYENTLNSSLLNTCVDFYLINASGRACVWQMFTDVFLTN